MTPEEMSSSASRIYAATNERERERLLGELLFVVREEYIEICAKVADMFIESPGPAVDTGQIWRSGQARGIATAIRALK